MNCEAPTCTQDCPGGGGCCASDGPSPAAGGAVPIAARAAIAPSMGAMCFRPIPIIDPSFAQAVSARSRSASRRGRRTVRIEGPRRRRIGDLNIAWRLAYGRRRFRVGARFPSLIGLAGICTGNWGARDCRRDSCSGQHWCDVFQSDSHSGTHFDVEPRRTLRPASTVGDNQEPVTVKRDTMRECRSVTSITLNGQPYTGS